MTSTKTYKQIRKGMAAAHRPKAPKIVLPWTAFGVAYYKEQIVFDIMGSILDSTPTIKQRYLGLVYTKLFGLANSETQAELCLIESNLRSQATQQLRAKE